MAYRNDWARYIRSRASRYNLDPRALLAVAAQEGLSGRVGDGGHAFGAFQANDAGGVLTGRPGNHRAFAESPAGIDWVLAQIGQVAGGLRGPDAVRAIVSRFERPANPSGEIARALSGYGKFGGAQAGPSSLPVAAPDQSPQPDIRRLLAGQLASGKGVDWLALARQRTMAQQAPQAAPQRMQRGGPQPVGDGGYPLGTKGKIIGTPYVGSHTLYHNWESDNAIDIATPTGTPVYALADGTIGSQIGPLNSNDPHLLGNRLHLVGGGNEFYYAHLSRLAVKAGQKVKAGQLLGYSGSANGVQHLHLAVRKGDPRRYAQ